MQHSVDTNTSSIFLNWTAASGSMLRYILILEITTDKKTTLNLTDTWAVLTNLTPGTNYTVSITAVAGNNVKGDPYTLSALTGNVCFC